jgi:hypothetical protein
MGFVLRLNIDFDLQSLFASLAQLYSLAETQQTPPPPTPRIWVNIRGRYWSAKIDDPLGLLLDAITPLNVCFSCTKKVKQLSGDIFYNLQ